MTEEQQVACFMAGANSVFTGEKMLTTDCNGWEEDKRMLEKWGFYPMAGFQRGEFRGGATATTATTATTTTSPTASPPVPPA
ncbi:biotin synthase [Histoplasma capsulatum H143]|nr:biotin synthase [Histoplasma capsulatum H143]